MPALPSPFGPPTGNELEVEPLVTKLLEPQLIKGLHLAKETFFGEKPVTAEPPADDINSQLKSAYSQQQSAGDDLKTAYAKQQEESGAQNDTLKRIFQLNQDIRSKTAQQLYDDPAFDPFEAFQTLESDLTPEDVDKLVETRKLQTAPGLHLKRRARALAQVPEAVSQFIKGGPQLLSRFADLGSPDKAIRTKAAAEIVTGMEQANLEVSDLLRTGLRKAKDEILDPSSITSIAVGGLPSVVSRGLGRQEDTTDHKQRFFTDLAYRRQIEGALEGKGFWTTLAGLDAKTLSEKGIEVDPDAIQNLSEWLDLTNFIPFGAGFKVAKQGARTTLKAANAEIAESFLTRARQKTAETLQKAGTGIEKRGIWTGFGKGGVGGAVIDIALGGTGLVGAGAGMLGGMVSPAAIRAAGRTVKFAGNHLAKPGPMLRLAETAAGAAARGAVAGTVASIPFAAAAETPEEQTLIAGVGAGLGTAGGVAALPVVQAQKGIAGIVNKSFEGAADLKPVARHSKPDSIDAGLESTHQGLMDRLEQLDPNYYNLVQRMRALVGAVGGELFFTDPATFKQRAGRTAEGAILEGDIEQVNPDGTTRRVPYMLVEFNGQRTPESLFHEPGHLLFKVMPEASRNAITAEIQDTFTPEQLQEINTGYTEWLGAPGNVIDEIASELISGVLRGSDLTGFEQSKFPKVQKMVQSAYEAAANALDQLGLYDITQAAAPGAVGQQLGFGLSPKVGDIVRGYLRSPEQAEAIKAAISELERTATPPTLVQPVQGTTRKPVVEPARRAPTAIPATPEARTQAATDAEQIAASAAQIVPPGGTRSARELLGDIASAIAQQVGVKINYLSALDEPAAAISSNRAARREMIELFRSMPQSARALWEKTFFPERLIQTGQGIQVLGWAPEVFAANAHKISKSVGNKSALLPYPVDPKTGTFTDAGWQELFRDTQTFVRNQLSGRTGAGEGLVVPADLQERGFYKPPVTGPAAPLDQRKADFINLLFGVPLPKTPRITKGKLPLNIAGQDISAATQPGRVSVPVEPRAKFGEGTEQARQAAEQLGITGREILEVNPLRAELEQAGVKLPGLIEAVQRLDANNIKEVQLAPEQPQFRGNTLTLSAGFQPKPADPRAVKMAAVIDRESKRIFSDNYHGLAQEKAEAAGVHGPFTDGFVTNSGEFLTRDEAFQRAVELKQLSQESESAQMKFLEADLFRSERQFQPPRDEREMPMAPGQRLIEVLGPDGTVYKARFDGYQEVPGRAPVAQITPVEGFPWQGDSKRSTTYETTIVKRGFKVPELPTPEQWESERVETGFTQFQPPRFTEEEISRIPGATVSRPERTYLDASQEAFEARGNPWVRRSATPEIDTEASNADRTLLVQITSELMNPGGNFNMDVSKSYYDKLYSGAREGYTRMDDFWEIPQWMGFASHIFPKADVYVVRDVAQAKQFLNDAGYKNVMFSALDVNKPFIKELAQSYNGKVDVGGWIDPKYFDDTPNVTWHNDLASAAKANGMEFKDGVDYRHFEGSGAIPRLNMSTGCKFQCAFCTVEKAVKVMPPELITQQAEEIAKLGTELVYLGDKTFGQAANYKQLSDLNTLIREKNPNFKGFVIQTTASTMPKFSEEWLAESGIKFVELGIETYNDPILRAMQKPATEALMDKSTDALRKNGITLIPNIIIGLPGETAETYARTLEFLKKNADIISHANIYNLAVYPDAKLAKEITTATPSDFNENILEKSFHENPEVHRQFAGDVYGLASELVAQTPDTLKGQFQPADLHPRPPDIREAQELWIGMTPTREDERTRFMPRRTAEQDDADKSPISYTRELADFYESAKRSPSDEADESPISYTRELADFYESAKRSTSDEAEDRRFMPRRTAEQDDESRALVAPEKEAESILASAQFMPVVKKKKEPLPLQLVHYSDSGPELTDIDPAFMRQVHPRFGQDTQKSFWFVKGSESGKAQLNFKNRFVYEAGVKNKKIYDATGNDPLGFFDKYADNWQAMDQNIIDAGYDGVRVQTNDGRQVVILYEKIPAKHIGQTDEFGNFHAVESGKKVTFKKKPGIGAVAVRWKGKTYRLLELLKHGSYPAKALENLGVLSLADFEESGFPIESGFINEAGEFVPEEQAFQQVGAQFQPKKDNDELLLREAERYFSIGHDTPGSSVWIYDPNNRSIKAVKDGQSHGMEFGHEIADKTYKGWYDPDKNIISVGFPAHVLRKLGRDFATEDDIPQGVYDALKRKFGFDRGTKLDVFPKSDAELEQLPDIESQFQPRRAEQEQLFGGRELLSSVELGKMTKAEIADHFPEAVIPAKRDEKIPSEITKSPLYKRAADDASAVAAFADKLAEFATQYKDDPLFKSGARWYSEFTPMLKREFGADAQLMAELLAATSPQTPPGTNFGYAFDALAGIKSGRFKKIIAKFNQGLDMLAADRWLPWYNKEFKAGRIPAPPAEPTPAAFLEHWIATHDLKPRQSNGKLYGQHSLPVLQVFVRRWLELNKGLKTRNFVENLTGTSHEATIDLWADRTMRRLGYEGTRDRWRILPQNGTGVSDEDFSFAQRAFRAAADKLGMKPDDLQGALWFAEKSLWADNGWGRIDLGDFRKEMEKLPLLRAGVRHRLAQTAASQRGKPAEESELLVEPRKLK